MIDADHSGSVTAEEFGEGIREHVERTGEKGLKKKEVVELIRDFDTDGDGEMEAERPSLQICFPFEDEIAHPFSDHTPTFTLPGVNTRHTTITLVIVRLHSTPICIFFVLPICTTG